PRIWDEIKGLADVLHMPIDEAVQFFGGYYLEFVRSGCSIFADTDFMVRNYDSHPRSYEGRYLFYQPSDSGYAVIGPNMLLTGRSQRQNKKALVMGDNVAHRKPAADGVLVNMIGRLSLETCADVGDAIVLLQQIPQRNSFSYVLLEKGGGSYVGEASRR